MVVMEMDNYTGWRSALPQSRCIYHPLKGAYHGAGKRDLCDQKLEP